MDMDKELQKIRARYLIEEAQKEILFQDKKIEKVVNQLIEFESALEEQMIKNLDMIILDNLILKEREYLLRKAFVKLEGGIILDLD